MIQTYVCLITLAISKSLYTVVQFGDEVVKILNSTIPAIGDDIANITNTFKKDLNSFINSLKSISFININLLTLDLDIDIQKFNNLVIFTDVFTGLQDLNDSIPTFADV